jgi:hypothetical protein
MDVVEEKIVLIEHSCEHLLAAIGVKNRNDL